MRPILSLLLLSAMGASSFSQTRASDPAAILLQQAGAAFSASPVQQLNLTGTANAYLGSDQPSGAFSYEIKATGESTLQLTLGEFSRIDTTGPAGSFKCQWVDSTGKAHDLPPHNCALPVNSIVPIVGLLQQFAFISSSVKSAVDANGAKVNDITLRRPDQKGTAEYQKIMSQAGEVTIRLDGTSFLPQSIKFNAHPDNDATTDIAIELRYSDYRKVSGALIPFHIERYLNNGLVLDLQVETAALH